MNEHLWDDPDDFDFDDVADDDRGAIEREEDELAELTILEAEAAANMRPDVTSLEDWEDD